MIRGQAPGARCAVGMPQPVPCAPLQEIIVIAGPRERRRQEPGAFRGAP